MEIVIRKASKADMVSVHRLIKELAAFEKSPDAVSNTPEDMVREGFDVNPVFGCHVAELNEEIVGMAIYFVKYSSWKGRGLYLDDLIVTEKHRGKGIGRKLFDAYVAEAKLIGVNQLHWQVLDWNTPAVDFYKKLGAIIEEEWWDCKMTKEQIVHYNGAIYPVNKH